MSYNGWTNYDTWAVALVINNEAYYLDTISDWIAEYASEGMSRLDAKDALAEAIKDMVESELAEAMDEISSPIIEQFLYVMDLSDIDYDEIAEGFLSDYSSVESYNAKPARSWNVKRAPAARKTGTARRR